MPTVNSVKPYEVLITSSSPSGQSFQSGKSALIYRLKHKDFIDLIPRTCDEYSYEADGFSIDIGEGRWAPKLEENEKSYLKSSDIVLLCCNLYAVEETLKEDVKNYLQRFTKYIRDKENIILVGTKVDVRDRVRTMEKEKLERIAKEAGLDQSKVIITSAKTGEGVNELFYELIPKVLKPLDAKHKADLAERERYEQELYDAEHPTGFRLMISKLTPLGEAIEAHPWRYLIGSTLLATVLFVLLTPGFGQAFGFSHALGWEVAQHGWQLGLLTTAASLFAFVSPVILGYGMGYLGEGAGKVASRCKAIESPSTAEGNLLSRFKATVGHYGRRFFAGVEHYTMGVANKVLGGYVFFEDYENQDLEEDEDEGKDKIRHASYSFKPQEYHQPQEFPNYHSVDHSQSGTGKLILDEQQTDSVKPSVTL